MKKYAEIIKSRVRAIINVSNDMTLPTDTFIKFIDVTNITPMPEENDYYKDGIFTYITNNPIKISKLNIKADGIDIIIISDLADRTGIKIADIDNFDVEDGEFSFSIDTPGEYKIKCYTFPYDLKEFNIHAY